VDQALAEVDVGPAERAELAHAQAGERCRDVDGTVELRSVRMRHGVHLLRCQHVELTRAPDRDTLGVLRRIRCDPALALGTLEDPVEQHEDLLDGAPRQAPLAQHALAKRVNTRGVDRVEQRVGPDLREEVPMHRVAVVADRRRPPVPLVRHVRQPGLARLAERVVWRPLVRGSVGSRTAEASSR
jgi:hypothetical protein